MTLFDYIKINHNKELIFIDADLDVSCSFQDILKNLFLLNSSSKKLAFLYLDNSLNSIKLFFSFLNTNHALCLLSRNINNELKNKLEQIYCPDFIVDYERENLKEYDVINKQDNFTVYYQTLADKNISKDLRILLSTSGTTGSPKFVKLTDKNFISNTESILDYLPIEKFDTAILNLPIHYSYGLSVLLTNTIRGEKIICTNETVLSRNFWNIFKKFECNSIAGVPYTYEMMTRLGFFKMNDLKLKYMTQAGGKLDVAVLSKYADYAEQNKISFYVMYGQTEATARMSYLQPELLKQKLGAIGKPIKNGTFSIDNENGELIYSGENVSCGYAETLDDFKKCIPLKELKTGDVAKVDEEGYYYITGRLKRFVKLFGNRVGLEEVETQLRNKFNASIGCCGINDKYLLIFSDNKNLNGNDVVNYITDCYKLHISCIKYIYLEKIPLTENLKLDYQKITALYAD